MRPILTLRQYSHDLIVHSHEHAQLVFGLSGALDFEVDGHGSQVVQQSFVVVPSGAHHACGSANGSRCLVLDVPGEQWVAQSLGDHAESSRRLLDNAGRLPYAALDAHIEQNAAYPLQVADLARVAGLSSARLHARFMAECGQTPMDYIRSRRLHLAVKLLRDTALPIGEVASRVGYSSQSAFSAAVLREFGASPSQLRRDSYDKRR